MSFNLVHWPQQSSRVLRKYVIIQRCFGIFYAPWLPFYVSKISKDEYLTPGGADESSPACGDTNKSQCWTASGDIELDIVRSRDSVFLWSIMFQDLQVEDFSAR